MIERNQSHFIYLALCFYFFIFYFLAFKKKIPKSLKQSTKTFSYPKQSIPFTHNLSTSKKLKHKKYNQMSHEMRK